MAEFKKKTFIAWIAGCAETAQTIEIEVDRDGELDSCPACEYANSYVFASDGVEFDVATDDGRVRILTKRSIGPFCLHTCINRLGSDERPKRAEAPTFEDIVMAPWNRGGVMHTVSFLDGEPFAVAWGDTDKGPIFSSPVDPAASKDLPLAARLLDNEMMELPDTDAAGELAVTLAVAFWKRRGGAS